jgi:F-type H+-transporting ATPase subunit epsilon
MAGGALTLRIITPERVVLEETVDQVSAHAIDGSFAVLPHHEPLITALAVDLLVYKKGGAEHSVALLGGLLEVGETKVNGGEANSGSGQTKESIEPGARTVTVLSDVAELDTEIGIAQAHEQKAREEAKNTTKTDKLDTYATEMALAKAIRFTQIAGVTKQRRGGQRHHSEPRHDIDQ